MTFKPFDPEPFLNAARTGFDAVKDQYPALLEKHGGDVRAARAELMKLAQEAAAAKRGQR